MRQRGPRADVETNKLVPEAAGHTTGAAVSIPGARSNDWTESALVLIGTELDKGSGAPVALLARQSEEGLSCAGGAFFAVKAAQRGALRARLVPFDGRPVTNPGAS